MTDPNHPAHPVIEGQDRWDGMTKREHFAALNHAAILTAAAFNQDAENMLKNAGIRKLEDVEAFIAHMAISAADALIAQLNKP